MDGLTVESVLTLLNFAFCREPQCQLVYTTKTPKKFRDKQERVMTKSAEYGTAFLYGTAP